MSQLKITFVGGAGQVTGSSFLLESPFGEKILVDCGLNQGGKIFEEENEKAFPFKPSELMAVFVTHAHLDHVGRIPKLVKDGFKGRIISTAPTRDIAELSLLDSMGVMEKEARRYGHHQLLYSADDVAASMRLWETAPYGKGKNNVGEFAWELLDAGHILGSAMVVLYVGSKKIVFSGDLGNSPAPILKDTDPIEGTDVLIVESTYGDRNHEDREQREAILEDVIEETVSGGGVLLIPAFSIERTQELLFEMNSMIEKGRIPRVPIFLDSPLAISVTEVYKKYESFFNEDAKALIRSGDDIFKFPGLTMTKTTDESKKINETQGSKIIMAGSGMSNGGRILHHEKRYLSDPKNTLFLIGYQAAGSLGRQLLDGAKVVNILGDNVSVAARVVSLSGYSAHKDSDHLLDFVKGAEETLEMVYCIHGEPKSSFALVQKIRDYLGIKAEAPAKNDVVTIEL